jgi:alkylhydroperoxidase family enzyme
LIEGRTDQDLEKELKRYMYAGLYPDVLRRLAWRPWLARAEVRCFRPMVSKISPDLAALTLFISCQQNSCRYCYGAARSMLKVLGLPEQEILGIERAAYSEAETQQPVSTFVRKLAEADPRPGAAELESLRESGLDPVAIAEIIGVVTAANFSNRNCTFLAVPPETILEKQAGGLVGLVLRLIWGKRNAAVRPSREDLDFEDTVDPFSPFVALPSGTAYARWLRSAIDACLSDEVIGRNAKLFMFAVVARTLQSPAFEQACEQALEGRGWSREDIQSGIESLSPRNFSQKELNLLAWTRETVWYVPFEVQRRTADFAREHTDPEFLVEAVGTAALANALARLGLLI